MDKINRNGMDPITMYPLDKIELMLTREDMAVPQRNRNAEEEEEDEKEFLERLIQVSNRV